MCDDDIFLFKTAYPCLAGANKRHWLLNIWFTLASLYSYDWCMHAGCRPLKSIAAGFRLRSYSVLYVQKCLCICMNIILDCLKLQIRTIILYTIKI